MTAEDAQRATDAETLVLELADRLDQALDMLVDALDALPDEVVHRLNTLQGGAIDLLEQVRHTYGGSDASP